MGMGFAKVNLYPTSARLKFGDRRIGEAKYAADIKVGTAGRGGAFATLVRDADIPALLREWAPEGPGGQLDSERNISAIRNPGVDIPLKVT